MKHSEETIKEALQKLTLNISQADRDFDTWVMSNDEYREPSWLIEICFLQLLAIAESMDLEEFRKLIFSEYSTIKGSTHGFSKVGQTPDGDPWSPILSIVRRYKQVLDAFFPSNIGQRITKDLLNIVRDIHYIIADKKLFGDAPASETDVHLRIEGILKCFYSDLKHKPSITKAIKNFEPDTGIPSIHTLIEYKFLDRQEQLGAMADEVLADTRGYASKDWSRFLYIIYETSRFRTEKEWNHLLRQCGVPDHTSIVVLGGEPTSKSPKR